MKNSSGRASSSSWTCANCPSYRSGIFSDLTVRQLKALEQGRALNRYAKGQILYYEGHHPMAVFCLLSGQIKVYKTPHLGGRRIQRLAGCGDLLGLECLLKKDAYEASAEAMEDSQVCLLPKSVVLPILEENSSVLRRLLDKVSEDFERRQNAVSPTSIRQPVRIRMAILLLELNHRLGRPVHWGSSIELSLTRAEMASMLGTTTETTIRVLNRFQAQGLISIGNRTIELRNISGLKALSR